MDQKTHEVKSSHQSNLTVADKSCPVSSTPVKKLQIHENQRLDAHFVYPTPEKTEEISNSWINKESVELPQKWKYLLSVFYLMTTSIRCLNLNGQLPTFLNICRDVEFVTQRKFSISYKNLKQIKFILGEGVQIEKVSVYNKETLSVGYGLKVSLNLNHIKETDYVDHFYDKLKKHLEEYDVPEAEIPDLPLESIETPSLRKRFSVAEPFKRRIRCHYCNRNDHSANECKHGPMLNTISAGDPSSKEIRVAIETLPNIDEAVQLNTSHFPPSFKKHSSTKVDDDSAVGRLINEMTTKIEVCKQKGLSSNGPLHA